MIKRERKKLAIKCTSTDCEADLHCFKANTSMKQNHKEGQCRYCGAELIDWKRVHERDLQDVEHTFQSLQREYIRHHFWHEDIDLRAIDHAKRKGRVGMREAILRRLLSSIGKESPFRDGYQTPYEGNAIYYAQHALGCCCRTCLEYWHDIPKGRVLSDEEIAYLAELVMRYIDNRLPFLTENGEKVPRRK